jgi:hypothetical protein
VNADSFDFNGHAYRRFVEKLKVYALLIPGILVLTKRQDTVDPKGILSPGKQGMWPERYRDQRDPHGQTAGPGFEVNEAVAKPLIANL